MRKQAIEKMDLQAEKKKTRGNKYNNVPVESHGIRFDSKKESKRYYDLVVMQKASQIEDLRLQVHFTLQEAFTTIDGEKVGAVTYIADFTYRDADGNLIIEDVKSDATRKDKVYRLKKRLMADKGYRIREV